MYVYDVGEGDQRHERSNFNNFTVSHERGLAQTRRTTFIHSLC